MEVKKKRITPRSFSLFADLTPELTQKVHDLATEASALLDRNGVPSVLQYLTQLFQTFPEKEGHQGSLASTFTAEPLSPGAEAYFALQLLTLQLPHALATFDPEVIQLLVTNFPNKVPRKPWRQTFLAWTEERQSRRSQEESLSPPERSRKPSEFHHCVTFRSERDGRSNFPSQWEFHAFCKQRDGFYSVKREWTQKEDEKGSSSSSSFFQQQKPFPVKRGQGYGQGGQRGNQVLECQGPEEKVKAVLTISSSPINFSHLATLLVEQFVMDGIEEERLDFADSSDSAVLKGLDLDPQRLAKLSSRMTLTLTPLTPMEEKGKAFPFAKFFLKAAASPCFNQHVMDRIVFELSQMEDLAVEQCDEEFLVKKSVLLAKLLGYLLFLPYHEDCSRPQTSSSSASIEKEAIIGEQVSLRSHQRPPLHLTACLISALKRSKLVLTLPWVIELLLAADSVSLQLPQYKEVLQMLILIYHNALSLQKRLTSLSLSNKNFLRFFLGKLFSSESFPSDLRRSLELELEEEVDASSGSGESLCKEMKTLLLSSNSPLPRKRSQDGDLPASDQNEQLGEKLVKFYFSDVFRSLKSLLHSASQVQSAFGFGSSELQQRKHIRPLPASRIQPKSKPLSSNYELQRQLETSFFDGASPSVKRTVDFISERLASNYVKILRKDMQKIRKDLALKRVFREEAVTTCRVLMLQELSAYIQPKSKESISMLIGEESLSSAALGICHEICVRQASDKVMLWVSSHIKAEMFPETPEESAPKPETQKASESSSNNLIHFTMLINVHRTIKKLHSRRPVSEEIINDIMASSEELSAFPGMSSTLLDFGLSLIAFTPSLLLNNPSKQELLIPFFKPWNDMLSSRNILILSEHGNELSWQVYSSLLKLLIQREHLNFGELESACFLMLRENLSVKESENVSKLLKQLISDGCSDKEDFMSKEVIDWVSWYCSEDTVGEF